MNGLTNDVIIAVGKAILPYLPSEISAEALGALSYDAALAVRKTQSDIPSSDNRTEFEAEEAEEAECVRMVLDDMGVPKRDEGGDLSLVGRVILAIVTNGKPVDPVAALHIAVAEHGSQKAFSERAGVSPQYVNDVLGRRREPGAAITQALGLERITAYRRV